jgi:site-specific DNA-methyltransferase (adenine-specific)
LPIAEIHEGAIRVYLPDGQVDAPLSWDSCLLLRETHGAELQVGPLLNEWALAHRPLDLPGTWRMDTGDCRDLLRRLPDACADSVVCDPPYELGFMGKKWDASGIAHDVEMWAQVLRVLKPGGHLLAFGGTRTYHRLTCAIEDAGFEIRDCLAWMYGQGFPKSLDVSKAIDKAAGAERKVTGIRKFADGTKARRTAGGAGVPGSGASGQAELTAPATPEAEQWEGWGTALKPGFEPIVLARKPFKGTVVKNVLEHGTGAINVDGCRIGTTKDVPASISKHTARDEGVYEVNRDGSWAGEPGGAGSGHDPNTGRWPANVVLSHTEDCMLVGERKDSPEDYGQYAGGYADADGKETVEAWDCSPDCPVRMLNEQSGESKPKPRRTGKKGGNSGALGQFAGSTPDAEGVWPADPGGGASRFFYCAKASKRERNAGVEKNAHPTVKPLALMRWLTRLVTPPGGFVLCPFGGSGSGGAAAVLEGFRWLGFELDPEYVKIANARITYWEVESGD